MGSGMPGHGAWAAFCSAVAADSWAPWTRWMISAVVVVLLLVILSDVGVLEWWGGLRR
ncbi:hypothetical protein PSD17_04270 [Pseudonocardia sp. D17]|nr:hypothetical protein PSD17_04270 [Pseudonocardia sp. D17]